MMIMTLYGLNPYSTGRYSLSEVEEVGKVRPVGLNPYSTGRYSLS